LGVRRRGKEEKGRQQGGNSGKLCQAYGAGVHRGNLLARTGPIAGGDPRRAPVFLGFFAGFAARNGGENGRVSDMITGWSMAPRIDVSYRGQTPFDSRTTPCRMQFPLTICPP